MLSGSPLLEHGFLFRTSCTFLIRHFYFVGAWFPKLIFKGRASGKGICKSQEGLGKSALWALRESTGHLRRRLQRNRGEPLEGTSKKVWKIHSFPLGWVCLALFPRTLASCNVHRKGSVAALSCVSVNSKLSLWEWRKSLAFCKCKFLYSGYLNESYFWGSCLLLIQQCLVYMNS